MTRKIAAINCLKKAMANCKKERKAKTEIKVKDLATILGVTRNYITNIENGHSTPSGTLFFEYLLAVGFDLNPIQNLKIEDNPRLSKKRLAFINEIYELDEVMLDILNEQLDLLKKALTLLTVEALPKSRGKKKK